MKIKAWFITVPVSFVLVGMSFILYKAVTANQQPGMNPVRHPTEEKWTQDGRKHEALPSTDFSGTDGFDQTIKFSEYRNGKPAVVVFQLFDCPCSIESQPLFNQLHISYQQWVKFVGIVQGPLKNAKFFVQENQCSFPILGGVSDDVIRAYGAERSVYSALVNPDGSIFKIYAGYSREMANEVGDWCAKFSNKTPAKLDLAIVPDRMASGCEFFPEPVPAATTAKK